MKIIRKYNLLSIFDFFAFHTNKKQYLDILHNYTKEKRNAPSNAQLKFYIKG